MIDSKNHWIMFLVLGITHLCSQLICVAEARGTRRQNQPSLKEENVQEDELVEALEILLFEKEDNDFKTKKLRRVSCSINAGVATKIRESRLVIDERSNFT